MVSNTRDVGNKNDKTTIILVHVYTKCWIIQPFTVIPIKAFASEYSVVDYAYDRRRHGDLFTVVRTRQGREATVRFYDVGACDEYSNNTKLPPHKKNSRLVPTPLHHYHVTTRTQVPWYQPP